MPQDKSNDGGSELVVSTFRLDTRAGPMGRLAGTNFVTCAHGLFLRRLAHYLTQR